jgi:Tol biopolymer transport system component
MRRVRVRVVLFSFVLVTTASVAGTARAVFPGENVRMLYGRAAIAKGDTPAVFSIRTDGTGRRRLTTESQFAAFPGHWSPDGQSFVTIGGTDQGDVYVFDRDGTNGTPVTQTQALENMPAWSPNGNWIVFVKAANPPPLVAPWHRPARSIAGPVVSSFSLVRIHPDGTGKQTIITRDAPILFPAFKPGTNQIAFASVDAIDGLFHTYVVRLDGTHLHKLTPTIAGEVFFDWSPDAERIAVNTKGGWLTRNVDGTEIKFVSIPAKVVAFEAVQFAPNGRLYVQVNDGADSEIWYVKQNGNEALQLTDNGVDDYIVFDLFAIV